MELDFIDVSREDGSRRKRVKNTSSNAEREIRARYAPDDSVSVLDIRNTANSRRKVSGDSVRISEDGRGAGPRKRGPDAGRPDTRRPNTRRVQEGGNRSESNVRNASRVKKTSRSGNESYVRSTSAGRVMSAAEGQAVRRVRRQARPIDPEVQKEQIRRRQIRRKKRILARFTVILCMVLPIVLLAFGLVFMVTKLFIKTESKDKVKPVTYVQETEDIKEEGGVLKPSIQEDFLTINEYSRPGEELNVVNNIFVHYTANKGTSAAQNRSYFENLGTTGETSASAHFIIGYDGEIIQCIPLNEIAYAVQRRNQDSISIECCYKHDDGHFTDETYQSLLQLSAWLLDKYNLEPEDMRRHFDEGGKKCPLYFVEHPESWEQFISDLREYIARINKGN